MGVARPPGVGVLPPGVTGPHLRVRAPQWWWEMGGRGPFQLPVLSFIV